MMVRTGCKIRREALQDVDDNQLINTAIQYRPCRTIPTSCKTKLEWAHHQIGVAPSDVEEAVTHQEEALHQEAVMAHHEEEACGALHHQAGTETQEAVCAHLRVQGLVRWGEVFRHLDTTMTSMPRACRSSSASLRRMLPEEYHHLLLCHRRCKLVKLLRWIRGAVLLL